MDKIKYVLALLAVFSAAQSRAAHLVISESPAGRNEIIECVAQIYNFNFTGAELLCRQIARQYPGHPATSLLLATNNYWQWYPERKDKQLESKIRAQLEDASEKSAKWISDASDEIPEAMFIYFSAQALLARMDNFAHATMSSVGHARNAYPYVKKSFTYHKVYPDFFLVSGLYNYYRQEYVIIKPFYKSLVWFMQDGDKQKGISQIRAASQTSLFSRAEAGIYLAHILTDYEKKPEQAYPGLLQLSQLYPGNLYIQQKFSELLLHLNMASKAEPLIEKLLESNTAAYRLSGMLNKARYDLLTGNAAAARAAAIRLQSMDLSDENALAYTHQILATLDAREGKVSLAKMHFKKVKQLSEYPILTDQADDYMKMH